MKAQITSSNFAIALTWAEWDLLHALDEDISEFLPDTWDFTQCDEIDGYEWNGHFGRYLFFTAKPGAESHLVEFLKKKLKPRKLYLLGLEQGESGADLEFPRRLSQFEESLFTKGFRTGQMYGKEIALTQREE